MLHLKPEIAEDIVKEVPEEEENILNVSSDLDEPQSPGMEVLLEEERERRKRPPINKKFNAEHRQSYCGNSIPIRKRKL